MASIVLRIRLVSGDHADLEYEEPGLADEAEVIDHVVSTLAKESGVLRCRHGERLIVIFGRGVATAEVSPRGPVL